MNVIVQAIGYLISLKFLAGYRSQLAGVGALLSGLTLIVLAAAGDPRGDVKTGVEAVVAGVAVLGLAGKSQKIIEASGK